MQYKRFKCKRCDMGSFLKTNAKGHVMKIHFVEEDEAENCIEDLKITEPQNYPTQELVEEELMKARKEAFEETQKLESDIDEEYDEGKALFRGFLNHA